MADEICGYEDTTTGEPCRHPAGSCPVSSHSSAATDGGNPQGRPSLFTDELAREAVAAIPDAYSTAAVEEQIGVGRGTIDNGEKSNDDWLSRGLTYVDEDGDERSFSEAFRRARGDTHAELIRDGIYDEDADSSFIKFILSTSYGHEKTEKREVSGEDGSPLQVVINDSIRE